MPASASATCDRAESSRRFLRVGGRHQRVELLLRDFVLCEQAAQTLDVARRFGRVRLCLAQARLRGRQPGAGGSSSRSAAVDAALGLDDAAARRA